MTLLEIYTTIMNHPDLTLHNPTKSVHCDDIYCCNDCPLSDNTDPSICYCSTPYRKQIFENISELKFQYKAAK